MSTIGQIRDVLREKFPGVTTNRTRSKDGASGGGRAKNARNVNHETSNLGNDSLARLGSLGGLSVKKFADTNPDTDNIHKKFSEASLKNDNIHKVTKDVLSTLSISPSRVADLTSKVKSSIQTPRKNYNGKLPPGINSRATKPPATKPPTKSDDDEIMKALLKSSLPKNLPKDSPAEQRKKLFEKMKAEQAKEAVEKAKEVSDKAVKMKRSVSRSSRPNGTNMTSKSSSVLVKQEPGLKDVKETKDDSKKNTKAPEKSIVSSANSKKRKSDHRAPLMTTIKREKIDSDNVETVIPSQVTTSKKNEPLNKPEATENLQNFTVPLNPPVKHQRVTEDDFIRTFGLPRTNVKKEVSENVSDLEPAKNSSGLSKEQTNILEAEFAKKDYLSRREMHSLAKRTGLLDAHVRDWYKARRIAEETPTIVEEVTKSSTLFSAVEPISVKQEPDDPYELSPKEPSDLRDSDSVSVVTVKTEPEDNDALSAVLDPSTGRLIKKSKVDAKVEEILSKAPVLDSLAKKLEMVNRPAKEVNSKDKLITQVSDIIEILDDDICITSENIVNPGPKENPLNKVLNKFLDQVEILEKTMDVNEVSKNLEIESVRKDNTRKEEKINFMEGELGNRKNQIDILEKELRDKSDEIESILLNSVSKETFIRTQFQNLTSEVRKMKEDKKEEDLLHEKIRELENKVKDKDYELDEEKLKSHSTQKLLTKRDEDIKELEATSTKMIGDITKGIGDKLAAAKHNEGELKKTKMKNENLQADLEDLESRFTEQTSEMVRMKKEERSVHEALSKSNGDLESTVKLKEEEIQKLKTQVKTLTSKFRTKVQEIQETLSNYHETLKVKNDDLIEKTQDIVELQQYVENQGNTISQLQKTVDNHEKKMEEMKKDEMNLQANLEETKNKLLASQQTNKMLQEGKNTMVKERKSIINTKKTITSKGLGFLIMAEEKNEEDEIENKKEDVTIERNKRPLEKAEETPPAKKIKTIKINYDIPLHNARMQHPIEARLISILLKNTQRQIMIPRNRQPSMLPKLTYNWPIAIYQPNQILMNLQFIQTSSPFPRQFEDCDRDDHDILEEGDASLNDKNSETPEQRPVFSSSKISEKSPSDALFSSPVLSI